MLGFRDVFCGGILPAVVAMASLSIVWWYTRHAKAAWLSGLSLGYLSGHWGLSVLAVGFSEAFHKSANPAEARDWLPLAVLLATGIELLALIGPKANRWLWALRVALCAWLPWRLLQGSVYLPDVQLDFGLDTQWSRTEAAVWLGSAAAVIGVVWLSAKLMPTNSLPRLRATLATLVALAGAMTIALSGSLTTGQLMGVLTAALAGCGIAAAAWRLETGPEGAAGPLLIILGGVLVIARFLLVPELELLATCLLLTAAYTAVGWIGPQEKLGGRVQALLRATVCLAAIAACVVPVAQDFAASQVQESDNPYESFTP